MNNNVTFTDKRLLEALDYIDESFIAEVTEDYKVYPTADEYIGDKKPHSKILRSLKYVAAVAACALLMSTLIPVVQYLSKNLNLTLPSHTLSETSESPDISSQVVESEFDTESEETIDPIEDTTYLGYLHYDGIEPISEEKMLEVRRAWAEWVYKETYADHWKKFTEYPDPYQYPTEEDLHKAALLLAEGARNRASQWFNMQVEGLLQPHAGFQRYYGIVNDYVVLATFSEKEWMMQQADIRVPWYLDGIKFYCMIYLYKDGELIEFNHAYNSGLINQEQANKIIRRHQLYKANLDIWWTEERSN